MIPASENAEELRRLVKDAVVEAIRDQRELLREIVSEVLEDLALAEAIRAGRADSGEIGRDEVFRILG